MQNPSNGVLSGRTSPVPTSTCKSALWASHFPCQVFSPLSGGTNHSSVITAWRGPLAGRDGGPSSFAPARTSPHHTQGDRYSVDGQRMRQRRLCLESLTIKSRPHPYQKHALRKLPKTFLARRILFNCWKMPRNESALPWNKPLMKKLNAC